MTKDEALKQALEALESGKNHGIAIDVLRRVLAEQPAQQDGPVNEGWQLTVANGHSGYGVYAHMEDYPEEGAVLVQSIEQPARQQEPMAWGERWYGSGPERGWWIVCGRDHIAHLGPSEFAEEAVSKIVNAHNTSPPPRKPWIGLTEQERNDLEDYCEMIIGKAAFEAIEAKLKERNT